MNTAIPRDAADFPGNSECSVHENAKEVIHILSGVSLPVAAAAAASCLKSSGGGAAPADCARIA